MKFINYILFLAFIFTIPSCVQESYVRHIKVTLDVSAKMIGLSKKTLDDYYLQIKLAESYGFDFQSH